MVSTSLLTIIAILSSSLTTVAAFPISQTPRSVVSIYYLSNCYLAPSISRAEIDYYHLTPATLPSPDHPTKIAVLNAEETIDYEDGTWVADTPFVLTVVIGPDAYTAQPGTDVGSATRGNGEVLRCYRLLREKVYTPADGATCTADYACY